MSLLDGKIAIITGSSSGIGLAACKAFVAAGCSVLGVDIGAAPSIDSPGFSFYGADLAHTDAPQKIVAACIQAFGPRIDILVNVAGILDAHAAVDSLRDEDWDRVIAINLTAPVRLMREVVNTMKPQKSGIILNVSSKAGLSGAVAGAAYTASKHGLVGVTKNTAWLLKDHGIRCNAICPGAVQTNLTGNSDRTKWDMEALMKMAPIHNVHANFMTGEGVMQAEIPADVLVFLASDLARGINGAVLPVDNAWSVI